MRLRSCCFVMVLLAACLATAGCTSHEGSLALVSTVTPDYAGMASAKLVRGVEASESRMWFLFIPFGTAPSFEEAIVQLLDEYDADFMVNARFYTTGWTVLLFSGGSCEVVGDVGNSRG